MIRRAWHWFIDAYDDMWYGVGVAMVGFGIALLLVVAVS